MLPDKRPKFTSLKDAMTINGQRPAADVTGFFAHLTQFADHKPDACDDPRHVVIKADNGITFCGTGGWWPGTGKGLVLLPDKDLPSGYFTIVGELIRHPE